ncbi:hypothetical protein [Clostridium tertium]|uniref:hypothetical protein n=1 Tax=Clostridium tertium TaxID=1559 RepID=UPI0023B29F31|nr:hypothetical protein [Clostridium tertium]
MDYMDSGYANECKKLILDTFSSKKTVLELAQKLVHTEKLLNKTAAKNSNEKIIILINYNVVKELAFIDINGTYSFEIDEDYDGGPGAVYAKLDFETIYDFLQEIDVFSIEYIPFLNMFNIKTIPYIEHIIANYPVQVFNSYTSTMETGDASTNTCFDYLHQFRYWWQKSKAENYRTLGKNQIKTLANSMIPIAVFTEQTDSTVGAIIQECIRKTVLQEHFAIDMFERTSKKTNKVTMTTIYWVSFKNALDFLDTMDYKKLSPVTILETLLANFGYIVSPLCEVGSKQYEQTVDEFGIDRFIRLNPIASQQVISPKDIDIAECYDEANIFDNYYEEDNDYDYKDVENGQPLLEGLID